MIEQATLARLATLLQVDAARLRAQPLPGGLSNRGCLLRYGSDQWAVRLPLVPIPGETAHAPGETARADETLSLESERRVLAVAAEAKLAPEPVVCDDETGALVTRFVEGATPLTAEQVREHVNMHRIAITLRRLHGLPAPGGLAAFRPTELARIYIDAACGPRGARRNIADQRNRWGPEFKHLAQAYEATFKPTSLCHNDLVAANILDDGQIWLVDFEYAALADPILDLAGLAGLNGFGPAHCHRLLDAYYGPERAPHTLAQLNEVIRLVQLMAFFWALAHGGGDPADELRRFAAAMAAVLR